MSNAHFTTLGDAIPRSQITELPFADFRHAIVDAVAGGQRIASFFGDAPSDTNIVDLYAVLADNTQSLLRVAKTRLDGDCFRSLTPDCPQAQLFEREIAEQYGVHPDGHPWFKPVRFHASYRPGHDAWGAKAGRNTDHRCHRLLPRRG